MRFLIISLALFTSGLLSAQLDVSTDGPVMAYQTTSETTSSGYDYSPRRERTLLGDLDLTGLWGGPTYNYSATGDDFALLRGGFGGLEFGEEVFLGYGGWKSRENFVDEDFVSDDPTAQPTDYSFSHSGFIFAYSPLRDNAIHPRITTIVGPGKIDVANEGRDRLLVGQAMVGLELNLFQWFRLGVDGGYRFVNGVDSDIISDKDVSGAVVQIEARFGFSW